MQTIRNKISLVSTSISRDVSCAVRELDAMLVVDHVRVLDIGGLLQINIGSLGHVYKVRIEFYPMDSRQASWKIGEVRLDFSIMTLILVFAELISAFWL